LDGVHSSALQLRLRKLTIVFFWLSLVCFTFANFNTCKSYVLTWLGYLPSVLVRHTQVNARFLLHSLKGQRNVILLLWHAVACKQRHRERLFADAHEST
jgi:hypothetical protein